MQNLTDEYSVRLNLFLRDYSSVIICRIFPAPFDHCKHNSQLIKVHRIKSSGVYERFQQEITKPGKISVPIGITIVACLIA